MVKSFKQYWLVFIAIFGFITLKAQDTKQNSLLWEISGNGLTKPSYLYGTIHIMDKRVFDFNDSVLPKLKKSDAFAMEIALSPENIDVIRAAVQLDSGKTLQDFFSKKDYAKMSAYLKKLGYDISMFEHMKPFALISVITKSHLKKEMPQSVDEYLYKTAKANDRQLLSIETVDEQVKALESIPIKEVMELVKHPEELDKDFNKMIDAYTHADLDKLQKLTLSDKTDKTDSDKKLLTDRNHIMADRIAAMAKKQPTFAAIGAAHLPGKEGVIALLQKQGYTVKPIIAGHTPGSFEPVKEEEKKDTGASYVLDNPDFTVTFPSEPKPMTQKVKTDAGEVEMNLFILQGDGDNMALTASYADYPKDKISTDPNDIETFLDAGVKKATEKVNGKLLSQKEIRIDGYPGREISIDYMNGVATIHMLNYLVGSRMYTLQAISAKDNNPAMIEFFHSFKLKK